LFLFYEKPKFFLNPIFLSGTNKENYRKKKEQWSKIESEFNSVIYEQYRPAHVLKCKFENICRQAQKKKFENIKQLKYTGGGKANLAKYVSADKRFLDLLGRRSSELNSKWCDDEGNKYYT